MNGLLEVRTSRVRSSANASQSCRDASLNAEGETDRVVDGASPSQGGGANTANDGWAIERCEDDAPPLPQVPALRPSLRDARSSRSTSLGDTRAEEKSRLTDKCGSGQDHNSP